MSLDQRSLVISTYEKAEAILRFLGGFFVDRIRLIVIDEAHMVQYTGSGEDLRDSNCRALRMEALVNRLFTHLEKKDHKVVALSAVATGIEEILAQWVTRTLEAGPVTTPYHSTRQLVGRLLCSPNRTTEIRFDVLDSQRLLVNPPEDSPYIRDPFPPHPPVPNIEKLGAEKRLRPHLFWAAIHLSAQDNQRQYHSVLISVPQKPGGYADDFLNFLENVWAGQTLPDFFHEPNDSNKREKWFRCMESCKDYFGGNSREFKLLSKGIVFHHGKMPGAMSRQLIELIQERVVNIVLATSTLTEGVNLPFEVVLIPSLRRGSGYLSTRELTNLIGRAGRPGISTEGRSLVLIDPISISPGQYGSSKAYFHFVEELSSTKTISTQAKGPLASLLMYIFEKWMDLAPRASFNDFESWLETTIYDESEGDSRDVKTALDTLDKILLEAIEEAEELRKTEMEDSSLEAFLQSLWRNSFGYYSSLQAQQFERVFITRGKSLITQIYPERRFRRRLYGTSLPPREGKVLINSISSIKQLLLEGENYYSWSTTRRIEYIASLIDAIQLIPSFSMKFLPQKKSWRQILHWWLDPNSASVQPNSRQVSDWYDSAAQNFGYRFNWGLGCVFSTLLVDISKRKSTLDQWQELGLPWSVFWLKDLINWGVLDPVAAYLLMQSRVYTRAEARDQASQYFKQRGIIENDSLYDPRRIKAWASTAATQIIDGELSKLQEFEYLINLSGEFKNNTDRDWHVYPTVDNEMIRWIDPAGYVLATGVKSSGWGDHYLEEYDFVLRPWQTKVIATRYL